MSIHSLKQRPGWFFFRFDDFFAVGATTDALSAWVRADGKVFLTYRDTGGAIKTVASVDGVNFT